MPQIDIDFEAFKELTAPTWVTAASLQRYGLFETCCSSRSTGISTKPTEAEVGLGWCRTPVFQPVRNS